MQNETATKNETRTTNGTARQSRSSTQEGTAESEIEVIEFTGFIPGWIRTIPGTEEKELPPGTKINPTLNLKAGQRYKIRWTNGDGVMHSFIIRDKKNQWIAGTQLAPGVGTTKSFEFTATKEMDHYFCTVHPAQMRGSIQVSGQSDEGPDTTLPDDISPIDENSTVTFKAQTFDGKAVTVESATLPKGGFVTIHTPRLKTRPKTIRDVYLSIVGWSDYLEPGTHTNITVPIKGRGNKFDESKYKKLIAMNHRDTNDNKQYDFFTGEAEFADADWPYFTPKGKPVIDPAKITTSGGGQ